MRRLKHNFKKGMAFVLSLAMVAGLVPAMSGGANTVQAATGSGTQPSVTAYATKDQLMTAFTPDANGTATTKGKLVFGKKSDGTTAQEWYILGKDTGVSGDNTIIVAASPIARGQKFNSDISNKNDENLWSDCVYSEATITEVYANHYGASELRDTLQGMATNTSYFTSAEQGLMNATTVTTKDTKNSSVTYTTTDKLYALQGDYDNDQYLWAGTDDSTVLAMSSYWRNGDWFWLRSPYGRSGDFALCADRGYYVILGRVDIDSGSPVQPASNLDLSSVLFASAATAASSDTKSEKITDSAAMTLRLDGTGKDIGTATYNTTTGDIKAVKGSTSQPVSLVVQGNDGTQDWFYSKQITGPETINESAIVAELNTPASIDLSACKIWLETTDSAENLTYAVNATETNIKIIHSIAITDIDTPVPNTALDTEASCTTEGVKSTTPQITWTSSDTTAGYNTSYTASITLTATTGYEFIDSTTATVSGNNATSITKNTDGTLTVTYDFPATAKDRLMSITTPQAITVVNGTAYSDMNLPEQVNIVTEGNTVSSASVTWNTTTPASGSYNPSVLTEQTVKLNGTVTCPDSIDDNGIPLTTTITITISATANPIPAPVSYKILDGANSDWKQNTEETITIRGNGDFSKFVGVKIDGNTIDAKNYTAKEGSTIITLTTDYLKTLSIGTHTFEIVWTDGSASTNFTVSKNNSGSETRKDDDKNKNDDSGSQTGDNHHITAPQTGDNSHPTLWISLLGASLIGLLATLYMRKKKDNE